MSKKTFVIVILTWLSFLNLEARSHPKKYVTYAFSGGRFGDSLIAYMHAKWISYKYGLPLLFRPFQYSGELYMHGMHEHLEEENHQKYGVFFTVNTESIFFFPPKSDTVFEIPFFPECIQERNERFLFYFDADWEDKNFRKSLKKAIRPLKPISAPSLPKGKRSVAVHLRLGGGIDVKAHHLEWPLKFPPHEFYINQIKRLNKILGNVPLYVYLFTDDKNPVEILNRYQAEINLPHIQFDCRKSANAPNNHVLEDFFAMTHFEFLIRAESNYSIALEKISNHRIIIYPESAHIDENENCVVDTVHIHYRRPLQIHEIADGHQAL